MPTTRMVVTITHPPTESAARMREWVQSALDQRNTVRIEPLKIRVELVDDND